MGRARGGQKPQKDLNTETRLLIERLSRVVADKQGEVAMLLSERQWLLMRGRATQMLLQTAEAAAGLVKAVLQKGQDEQLNGAAGSRLQAQLQEQLQGLQEELAQLQGSAREGGTCGGGGNRGDVASGTAAVGGMSSSGTAGPSASPGDSGSGGAGSGNGRSGATSCAFAAWLPPPPPLCWTVEQALAAAGAQRLKGWASDVAAFAAQAAPLLSHVNSGAPDEAVARAKLDQLRSGLVARGAAQFLTSSEARLADAIFESFLGPKPCSDGNFWNLSETSEDAQAKAGGDTPGSCSAIGGGGGGGGGAAAPGQPCAGPGSAGCGASDAPAPEEPPPGYWRWLVQQLRLTAEQELLFDAFMELWWERVTPMWQERADLLAALQSSAQGAAAGGFGAAALAGGPGDEERLVSRLAALQCGLASLQTIFGVTFGSGVLTSWQLCQGFALAQPYVPSFMAVDQGLRELRAARAARAAGKGGGGNGLMFHAS